MKTGLCSVTFRDRSIEEVVQLAKQAQLDAIEWEGKVHVPHEDLEAAKKAASLTEEAGLVVSSYGSYYIAGSTEPFQGVLRTAQELNTNMIRIWAGDTASKDVDEAKFDMIVRDVKLNAHLAQNLGITLSFEYHSNTLTDTPESAVRLLEAINEPNVKLYWQPSESLTFGQRIASLPLLKIWLTNVHVFHWKDYRTRYTLEDGSAEWIQYFEQFSPSSLPEQFALLEFVKNDSPEQMKKDAEVLKQLVHHL
ncbi:sugar phosphate isomerase/epimerase [Desemzia sp. RIT804]|uniref:sugar phosphate isomerase/epimerase family protein n=1 Tax=Desemzia sp. RIT 804 TaxID=2810209 RepID=UPI001951B26F|nr:TIM barrel protein [Desemzia sp. RIT 804]MBM6614739.1 sugar phosphate isomerase/epimerase [Desemzia sp. RIT 804]